jgi:hypothetical protein
MERNGDRLLFAIKDGSLERTKETDAITFKLDEVTSNQIIEQEEISDLSSKQINRMDETHTNIIDKLDEKHNEEILNLDNIEHQSKQTSQTLLDSIETLNKNMAVLTQKIDLNVQPNNQQITKKNSFDDLHIFFQKPDIKPKRKNRKPKPGKSNGKEKEPLKLRIGKAARDSKDTVDFKTRFSALLNQNNPLKFGDPEIELIRDKDPLDQMIEKNIFPLLDE